MQYPARQCSLVMCICILLAGLGACNGDNDTVRSASELPAEKNNSNPALPPADDRLEPGLQGQIPISEQLSGSSTQGYRKGLRLVGQNDIMKRGANFSLAWIDDCAYVTTTSGQQLFGLANTPYTLPEDFPLNGVAVIDAADPTSPQLVHILQSPVMRRAHESLQAHEARKIIVATSAFGSQLEVWDASDCRNPVLRSTLTIGNGVQIPLQDISPELSIDLGQQFAGHALCLAPDGMTAYAAGVPISNAAIDLSDLDNPRVVSLFTPGAHDCGVSPDGNRLYLAVFSGAIFGTAGGGFSVLTSLTGSSLEVLGNLIGNEDVTHLLKNFTADTNLLDSHENSLGNDGFNGLIIADVSELQAKNTNASISTVGILRWTPQEEGEHPAAGSHTARYFRQGDKAYVYSNDEWPLAGETISCPWGHGRIIDITDEGNPVEVSDISLDVHKLENCPATTVDLVNYSAHYVGFDDPNDAKTLFTTWYGAGLRVHDISDPANPEEIAYWHPKPVGDVALALNSPLFGATPTWDAVPSYVRYRPESGHIWIVGVNSGFQILEFTASAGPNAPLP